MNLAVWPLSKLHRNEPVGIVTDRFATATLADSLAASAIRTAETARRAYTTHPDWTAKAGTTSA